MGSVEGKRVGGHVCDAYMHAETQFPGQVMVDEEKGRLYYMEGFVYYPNEVHREALREIETILLKTDISYSEEQGA